MGPVERRRLSIAAIVAAAGAGCVLLASTARSPLWIELPSALARAGFWAAVVVVAARLGAALTRSRLSGCAHLVWDGAAGLPVLMSAWLVVGLVPGGFARGPIVIVLSTAAVLAAASAWRDRTKGDGGAALPSAAAAGAAGAAAGAILCLVLCIGLAWDRVPPVFFDTVTYHWAQPELWLVQGRIAPVTWSIHSWYPPGMSVLYGVGLTLGGVRLANDANLMMGLMLSGLAWDLGSRRFGPSGGLFSLAVLLSFPIVIHALGIPAADLGHGLFAGGALAALALSADADTRAWRRRAALLAAGAVLTKFLGLVVPLAVGALWVALGRNGSERSTPLLRRAGFAALFVLPALLLAAPWFAANARVTGNPVAPAAASLMPPEGMAAGASASFRADARGGWPKTSELPFVTRQLFGGAGAESPFYPVPAWGFMPVVLLLALPLVPRAARSCDLLALAGIALTCWLFTYRWERFLVAVTFLLAVALGGVLAAAWRQGGVRRLAPLLAVLVGAAATVESLGRVGSFTGGGSVFLGREEAAAFFERSFAAPRVVSAASGALNAKTTRILFVGESRHYGLAFARVAPTGFNVHPLVTALAATPNPAQARAALVGQGFTHLLVDPGWIDRSGRSYPSLAPLVADPAPFVALLGFLGPPIASDAGVSLYALTP